MFKKAFGANAYPAVLVGACLAAIQNRDAEHADNPRELKNHAWGDVNCNIEQTRIIINALVQTAQGDKYSIEDMDSAIDYVFMDLSGRCAKADLTLDFIQTIYASTGVDQDKRSTYLDPIDGAITNFGEALGFFLTGDDGTAFSRLLQGLRYLYDVDGFDPAPLMRFFNEDPSPDDLGG